MRASVAYGPKGHRLGNYRSLRASLARDGVKAQVAVHNPIPISPEVLHQISVSALVVTNGVLVQLIGSVIKWAVVRRRELKAEKSSEKLRVDVHKKDDEERRKPLIVVTISKDGVKVVGDVPSDPLPKALAPKKKTGKRKK